MNVPALLPFEKRTVFDGAGRADLGSVTVEVAAIINRPAGPIRLLNGIQGRQTGFGLAHIESHQGRVRQFEQLGFRDTVSYARFIACDYDLILGQEDERRLIFQREGAGCFNQLVCQWDGELQIWSTTTAIPKRAVRDPVILWRKG